MTKNEVRCDWCGKYMKKASGGLLDAVGLGLVQQIGNAATKHFCSKKCKLAYNAAQSSGGGGTAQAGGAGPVVVVQKKGMLDSLLESDANMAKQRVEQEKEEMQSVLGTNFEGSAEEIETALNNLFVQYPPETGVFAMRPDIKKKKNAIREKLEFGIMKLRKLDAETADFFQKKLNGLK
jgi:hypothetical protein